PSINTAKGYALAMDNKKWNYGNANLSNVYYDEINRIQLLGVRKADLDLALDLIEENKLTEARNILEHDDKMIRQENLPYGMTSGNNMHNRISIGMMEAAYRVEDAKLGDKIAASVERDLLQQQRYYKSLNTQQ